ncbi:putative glycoside hydrolase [Luminiphilus sp.]|nr:putative glycoside hydrolase [Luminiphilus sp.]
MRYFIFILSLFISPLSTAQDLVEFENGQVADANDMNANFSSLKEAIDSISVEAGATLLTGQGLPDTSNGAVGDVYIDVTSYYFYGPKKESGWGIAVALIGPQGDQGDTGAVGPQGETGAMGAIGPQGATGPKGDTGDTGATGANGPQGETGPQGPQGEKGETGATGLQGGSCFAEQLGDDVRITCDDGSVAILSGSNTDESSEPSPSEGDLAFFFDGNLVTTRYSWKFSGVDSAIGYRTCDDDCPSIDWSLTADPNKGDVIQVTHSPSGAFALFMIWTGDNYGADISGMADGSLNFDVKVLDPDANLVVRLDCAYPCTSGDQSIGAYGIDGWERVSVPMSQFVSGGLDLSNVNAFQIWASEHTDTVFQLDNIWISQ